MLFGEETPVFFTLRPLTDADRAWVREFMIEHWGDEIAVVHDTIYRPVELPGFAAFLNEEVAGLVTYHIKGDACEIVTLDSLQEGLGIGTRLIEAVREAAIRERCTRLWLVTTNDNTLAFRFYQKRGFRLIAVRPGAVEAARRIKPKIPLIGNDGIPIRDELELEISPLEAAAKGDQTLR